MSSTSCITKPERPARGGASKQFQFVSVSTPGGARNKDADRQARSHAVRQALATKRKTEQQNGDNFRVATKDAAKNAVVHFSATHHVPKALIALCTMHKGFVDPFQMLAIDSSRLQTLLQDSKSVRAPEPVFCIGEALSFQSFQSVFRTGLVDPALACAVMFALVFGSVGSIDAEALWYQGEAIRHIRSKIETRDGATSEATIGAILLLAGIEARVGTKSHVQMHLAAVRKLLSFCQADKVRLTNGIKRAIFWQDLYCSVLSGSNRIVDHTTFSELRWPRERFPEEVFCLPPGLETRTHLFTPAFLDILKDVEVLKGLRDGKIDSMTRPTTSYVSNHAGSIQSRLMALPSKSVIQDCCSIAAFICASMMCCTIWGTTLIPPHMSTQILEKLQDAQHDPIWEGNDDIRLWLVFIGGAFASADDRITYISLLRQPGSTTTSLWDNASASKSWADTLHTLRQFIWSDRAFLRHGRAFWEDVQRNETTARKL